MEIDGKEVKKKYKVFFLLDGKLVEAKKTSTGFIIPAALRNSEHLTVFITLGKYKFKFSDIHISKFDEEWVLGVDNKPFSQEIDYLIEEETVKRVYYIDFLGSALEAV